MKKALFTISIFLLLFSCTSSDKDKHIFHYTITGNFEKALNLYGRMGPGIEFDSPSIPIPFEVSHEVYGKELEYELRIDDTDTSHHYSVKIYIDDLLIKESSTYDTTFDPPRISVSGKFVQ